MSERIVAKAENWQDMDGDTELEKKLNSYLTFVYISGFDVPSDECLTEARKIIKMVEQSRDVQVSK